MAMNMEIPQIAITKEIDNDDDDNDNDNKLLSLVDALTDIEDLSENVSSDESRPRRKLMIRLDERDYLTDQEDFDASDAEDDPEIVAHEHPISLDDLDLGDSVFEESYNAKVENTKGQKKKLKTQMSVTHENRDCNRELKVADNITDEEAFGTDNEVDLETILETNFDLDEYNAGHSNISENFEPLVGRTNSTDSNSMQTSNFLNISSMDPKNSDLTDMEVLSDTDDEKSPKKTRSRRRKHRVHKQSVTDVEDLDISDDDAKAKRSVNKKEKKQKHKILTKSHSLAFDSDNETNSRLPFPVCKKVSGRKQGTLNIPDFDSNILTDTEELENFSEVSTNSLSPTEGDAAFEKKLEAMADSYSQTAEAISEVKNRKVCESKSDHSDDVVIGNATDIDDNSTDDSEILKQPMRKSASFDIEFRGNYLRADKKHKTLTLAVPTPDDEALTDCENLNSSEDENELHEMPLALIQSKSWTDEENLIGHESDADLPEVELPPVTRNLIILKDNGDVPTIQILPLQEEHTDLDKKTLFVMTDEESLSGSEDESESHPAPNDIPPMDCGVINETQNTCKQGAREDEGDLTDTEEVIFEEKRRRAPKFKHMHERFLAKQNQLTVRDDGPSKGHTDTEDLYMSDADTEQFYSLSPIPTGLTDIENLAGSSDEDESHIRAISCTPTHMRELGGESVLALDGQGEFSQEERLTVTKQLKLVPDFPVTPVYTDSEDVATSADEDQEAYIRAVTATPNQLHRDLDQESSSSVHFEVKRKLDAEGCMYLKGGGYCERSTDVEEISEDDWSLDRVLVDGKIVSLNFLEESVRFGAHEEWEAEKPHGLESVSSALGKDAAQKGEEEAASSRAPRDSSATSARPEGEEGNEKDEPGYERNVTDQHQLSEEMKALLKELEKESKQ